MHIQELLVEFITYLRGMWRFRWYAMAVAWTIAVGGWIFVSQMPNQYQSSAKVLVDTDTMLRPLLHGLAIQSNVSQRVELMTKTLLSRPNLEKVARMTDLDIKAETPQQMEALVALLRKNIRLIGTRTQDIYTVTATHSNPQTAKNIVQAVLTIFIEDTLGNNRRDSNVAQKFLTEQIKEYETRLVEAENRIKKFKQENIDNMPGSGRDYFEQLQAAQVELESASLQLREAQHRRDELNRQIMGEEPVFGFGTQLTKSGSAPHQLDERIKQLREEIDKLLLVYTEKHPDVIARRAALKALLREKEEDLKSAPTKPTYNTGNGLEANPVYQQLKVSLAQTEADISSLTVRVKEYEGRVAKYKKLVNTGPEIEAQLKNLNRDYALNKQNYDVLVARLESAKLGEEAEQSGDNVKFETIEPPRIPTTPSGPNRLLFSTAALFCGLAIGIGLAFILSQLKPVVYDRRTLKMVAGYPVFGTVSRFWTPELQFRKKIEFGTFLSVGFVLALAYMLVLALQQGHFNLIERLGNVVGH